VQFLRKGYVVHPQRPGASSSGTPVVQVVLLIGLIGWQWIFALATKANLPERYPVHFDIAGRPDRWATGPAEWFVLPIAATFVGLILAVLGLAADRIPPRMVNVPDRSRFLALPPADQRRVLGVVAGFSATLGVGVEALLAGLQYLVYRAVSGATQGLDPAVMGTCIGGFVVFALVGSLRLRGRVRRAIDEADRFGQGR
jgi:uncharacterized membrane protein